MRLAFKYQRLKSLITILNPIPCKNDDIFPSTSVQKLSYRKTESQMCDGVCVSQVEHLMF